MADDRDLRSGTFDPGSDRARRPKRRSQKLTPHQSAQQGAVVRSPPRLPQPESPLPEGIKRPPKGPLGPKTGRRSTKG